MLFKKKERFAVSENRDDLVNNKEISLADMPKDVVTLIGGFVYKNEGLSAIDKLSKLSRRTNHFFKPVLNRYKLLRRLNRQVAFGEKNEVEKMLQFHPKLLYLAGETKDEAGRNLYGTPLQIALGANDMSPFPGNKVEEMVEMIERYLLKLPNGKEERQNQYDEQFPEGIEEKEEKRRTEDSFELNKVYDAINNDQSIDFQEAEKAVRGFSTYLENQKKNIIRTGYHFNEALFVEALKLYELYYDVHNYACGKNKFAAVKVIGRIQKDFTACLASAACDGFGTVVNQKRALTRRKLLDDKKTSFFDAKLGDSHFVYSYEWGDGFSSRGGESVVGIPQLLGGRYALAISTLMSGKNKNFIEKREILKSENSQRKIHGCRSF